MSKRTPMTFMVSQLLNIPYKAERPNGRHISPTRIKSHDMVIRKIIKTHGYITSGLLVKDQSISDDGAFVMMRLARDRGLIVADGKVGSFTKYVLKGKK